MKKKKIVEELNKINDRLDELERKLQKKITVYNWPKYPNPRTDPSPPSPYPHPNIANITKCAECGMEFIGLTTYYCPRTNCPTFVKAT